MWKQVTGAIVLLLAVSLPAAGQTTATLSGTTCPGDGCLSATIETTGLISIQVAGTFDGTIVFERTVNGTSWTAWTLNGPLGLRSTTTTTGVWTGETDGSAQYRIRFSLYWSGSATVTYNFVTSGAGNFSAKYLVGQADATLPNAQNLGALTAGLMKLTITPGVTPTGTLGTATDGTDFISPNVLAANVYTFLTTPSSANLLAALTTKTGTGSAVFSESPTLTTPNLGTPAAINLANAVNMPVSGLAGLGTGMAAFLATPSSANLLAALTTKTGTGNAVFGTQPTISAPTIDRIANLTTNGVIVTTGGNGTLSIGSALPDCSSGQSPLFTTSWGCATLANTAGSYSNPSWITGLAWSKITGTPTTVAGYGITDGVTTGGSYSNPSWITGLAWSKITGTPTTVAGYGITDIFARGTITADAPFQFTQTWNNAAVTFTGLSVDITDTASTAGSALVRWLKNGTEAFSHRAAANGWLETRTRALTQYWCQASVDECQFYWQIIPGSGDLKLEPNGGTSLTVFMPPIQARKLGGATFSPTVTGDGTKATESYDLSGSVVATVTGAGSITVTFQNAFANAAPHCLVQNNTTANAVTYTVSTTALVISGTFATGDRISYACFGR